ncbi:MAG: sulfatase-like hydrolase/transferase [Candidatus Hydrogenedentes bacterium]|nr:sulfatase-like hydrolase/transferase [Candidatus Hydrogenedentota bacterium]
MIAVYLLTLAISGGIVGLFARMSLSQMGYVPGFQTGVLIAVGAASAYVAVQLTFMTLARLLWPTRTNGPLVADGVSHAACVFLMPLLLGIKVPWPHPLLYEVEPLIYFAAFAGIHSVLKLFSLYAILHSSPGPRLWSLAWIAATCVFCLTAYVPLRMWLTRLDAARPHASGAVEWQQSGDAYAPGRVLPEGALLDVELAVAPGESLTLRWANAPEVSEDDRLEGAYVYVKMRGDAEATHEAWVPFTGSAWATTRIPADALPSGLRTCEVSWLVEKEPKWREALGIRPVSATGRTVLMSGPFTHAAATAGDAASASMILIVVDGLGTDRVSSFGYKRETTASLDALGKEGIVFPNAYTPAPDAAAAVMSILTGVSPLRHQYLGDHHGPLPEKYRTLAEALAERHIATAAFTEAKARGDLAHGGGVERGFECFDAGYVKEPEETETSDDGVEVEAEPALRSAATLDRALRWISEQQGSRYFVLVRLSELREKTMYPEYASDFVPASGKPSAADIYDAGLAYLDRRIGAFLKGVRDVEGGGPLYVVVTSTHGADFDPPPKLTESVLRVPLMIAGPGVQPLLRTDLAALEDLGPALAELAGVKLSMEARGSGLLTKPTTVEPVSMAGDPLVLTLRNDRWRLYWPTTRRPFGTAANVQVPAPSLYDLASRIERQPLSNVAARYPEIVQSWTTRLERYLEVQSADWAAGAAK